MPDPITWYTLAKKVDDPTTIDEEIDAKILQHNLDPSAHGQSDEAIYLHRISQTLDHVNYSIYNIKLHPETRPIKAFVDAGGAAEFSDLQTAIDYVHALGGGRIFVKEGTYYPKSNITLYSNIYIEGDDDDTTIIDFENGDYCMQAVGTAANYLKNIEIVNIQVKRSGAEYKGGIYLEYVQDSFIKECYIKDNTKANPKWNAGIQLKNCKRILIEKNRFYNNDIQLRNYSGEDNKCYSNYFDTARIYSVVFNSSVRGRIVDNIINNPGSEGILCEDAGDDLLIVDNKILNFTDVGIDVTWTNYAKIINNNLHAASTSSTGIEIHSSTHNIIAYNLVEGADSFGIYLDNETYDQVIGNNLKTIAGTGITINSECERCIVLGNHVYDGVNTKITNNGINTELGHNITA